MQCKTCGGGEKVEIAAKTAHRDASGTIRCHRLECGHAWHVAVPAADGRPPVEVADLAHCTCGEIAIVNSLLVEGRRHATSGEGLSEDAYRPWLEQVLQALDGIPAESGAPSLIRSATLAAKSQKNGMNEKVSNLNKLLGRAIKAVS